jgi:hypothetical protein
VRDRLQLLASGVLMFETCAIGTMLP